MSVEERLQKLGVALPAAPPPAGMYRPAMIAGGLLFISGQVPRVGESIKYPGRIGAELTEAEGAEAARLAALNVLSQINSALGGFERLVSLARVEGYVSSAPGWIQQPRVLDSASRLFRDVLGEKGDHTRSAIAVPHLPLNASIELVVTALVSPGSTLRQ